MLFFSQISPCFFGTLKGKVHPKLCAARKNIIPDLTLLFKVLSYMNVMIMRRNRRMPTTAAKMMAS